MKRVTVLIPSLRQRDSILITPRAMLLRFWTILMSVERLNSVVKSVVGKRRFLSMSTIGTVNFVTNCVPAARMVRLLLAPVVKPPEN